MKNDPQALYSCGAFRRNGKPKGSGPSHVGSRARTPGVGDEGGRFRFPCDSPKSQRSGPTSYKVYLEHCAIVVPGGGRLVAPLSFATAFCPRRIAPRPKLPHRTCRAVAEDLGRLVLLVRDEGSPEVALIAFRPTLDTLERHVRLLFPVGGASQSVSLAPRFRSSPVDGDIAQRPESVTPVCYPRRRNRERRGSLA
jgi:hypothetical protein